jgi:hypothetical protein
MSVTRISFPFLKGWKGYAALALAVIVVAGGAYALLAGSSPATAVTRTWSTASDWNSGSLTNAVVSGHAVTLASAATGYASSGSMLLTFDAPIPVTWNALADQATTPSGTTVVTEARTITSNATWSAWTANIADAAPSKAIQLQVSLATAKAAVTPTLTRLTLTYTPPRASTPSVVILSNSFYLTPGQSTILTWSSANATACTASGAWRGTLPASGSFSTGDLTATSTYTLRCSSASGSASAAATVSVSPR